MLYHSNYISNASISAAKNTFEKFNLVEKEQKKQSNYTSPYHSNFNYSQSLKAQVLFGCNWSKITDNQKIAKRALKEINKFLKPKGEFNYSDWYRADGKFRYPDWYVKFRDNLVIPYDDFHQDIDAHQVDNIFENRSKGDITNLRNTLRSLIWATDYKPVRKPGIPVPIHNPIIAEKLKPFYTLSEFDDLFKFCDKKGVFDFKFKDNSGLPQTCVMSAADDPKMEGLIWVTDTCRNIGIMKDKYPEKCTQALNKLADYYKSQDDVFERIANNPNLYARNPDGSINGYAYKCGLGHVFNKETLETHSDFPRTRLESPGLYLSTVCDAITDGLVKNKSYGFRTAEDVTNGNTVYAITNLVDYFNAIKYYKAPSCGPWEEGTFNNMTSDTETINNGLRKVRDLLFNPEYDAKPEIAKVRKSILEHQFISKKDESGSFKDKLDNLINEGEQRVRNCYLEEAPGQRKSDAAMAFITHTAKLDDDPVKDVEKKLEILNQLEKDLVRENGMIRYRGDEYKRPGADITVNDNGEITSHIHGNGPNLHEAEWFMVSVMAKGYGILLKKLLNTVTEKPDNKKLELIKTLLQKHIEYTNRTYARITPRAMKANGKYCPPNCSPESYVGGPTLLPKNPNNTRIKDITYMPGTNNHLAWAQSSGYEESPVLKENLITLEEKSKAGFIDLKEIERQIVGEETSEYLSSLGRAS